MSELSASTPEADKRTAWGGVTDPTHHDPKHFRYLIHIDSGQPAHPGETVGDEAWEYAIHDTAKLNSLPFISASLVDENHALLYQGSVSNHGFIIEAPRTSIVATNPRDIHADIGEKTLSELQSAHPVLDPDQLLDKTKPTDWNEVLVTPDGLAIKAVFWVQSRADDKPDVDRSAVEEAAKAQGLPFIELDLEKL